MSVLLTPRVRILALFTPEATEHSVLTRSVRTSLQWTTPNATSIP
jgi:hypothetical protein